MSNVTIQKRGNFYQYKFEIAKVDGKRKFLSKSGFKTKSEAEKEGVIAYNDYLNTGNSFSASDMSYSDFLDYWLEKYCYINLKYHTIEGYSNIIKNHVKPNIGYFRLSQITRSTLQEFINKIYVNKSFSKNFLNNIKKVIKGSFTYAYATDFIKVNPAIGLKLPKYIVQQHRMKRYNGKLNIYCDDEIKEIIDTFMLATFHKVHIDLYKELVIYNFCKDYKKFSIIGYDIEVIDLHSNECIQYGFKTILNNGKNIAFLGDVPCSENICDRINNFDWILHEAFCLEKEEPIFKAREKNHSVVKDVAEKMEMMKAKNLILWHTIDNDIKNRKKLYIEEAKKFFLGNVYVPNDLEEVIL